MDGPPLDVRERLAATLRARGELDWLELWPDVMRWRAHLLEALGAVEPTGADWLPRDGGWSAIETVGQGIGVTALAAQTLPAEVAA